MEESGMRDPAVEPARKAAEHYSRACQVPCRVVDVTGATLYRAGDDLAQGSLCERATRLPDQPLTGGLTGQAAVHAANLCNNAHLYGCYQAERFGGQYVYFCPLGLTHWVSPVVSQGQTIAALVGGPVHLVDPDDLVFDGLAEKLAVPAANQADLDLAIRAVPVVSTERVNSLSELLYLTAAAISDPTFGELDKVRQSADLQAELWDQINFLKGFAYVDEAQTIYPINKEDELLEKIAEGDKTASQQILNEILGHIFFSSSGSMETMRARVIELVVLLSRAAIRGGADVEQIFGLNYTYLGKIQSFRNIDEIAYWLSGIMTRFTDQVFNLAHVKHADVIYRAVDYVKKNYMKKITLEETAALVFLSPAYFSRIFKEEMGTNFNNFVNQYRVEAARKLLLNDTVSLTDISSLVGFEGQSYFSKVFKRLTGVSPGKFRESRGRTRPVSAEADLADLD
jgi:AraC-like DNA-binding protein/ligand-binding sensor protein